MAPISKKTVGAGQGALVGVGLSATVAELIGQMPALEHTNSVAVKALGAIAVAVCGWLGAHAGAWLRKESDDFLGYAAQESGKVLVSAEHAGLITAAQGSQLDAAVQSALARIDADSDHLFARLDPAGAPDVDEPDPVLDDEQPADLDDDPVLQD